jgi:hypothetical protein
MFDVSRRVRRSLLRGLTLNPQPSTAHVQRTLYADARIRRHMSVNLGGAHVFMSEQFLHRAEVVFLFNEMGGKRMSQAVTGGGFVDSRQAYRSLHRPLQALLVHDAAAR